MDLISTSLIKNNPLPLVIKPKGACSLEKLLELLRKENSFFKNKLLSHGGLLFRGFPVNEVDHYIAVIKALNTGPFVDYIGGGSPRKKIKEGVYTSTEAPPTIKIQLHNEMSFANNFPSHIYFYCEVPPEQGGETFIGDARKILRAVDPRVTERLEQKGLKYVSRYYYKSKVMDLINRVQRGHKTWIDVFETDQKLEVEKRCRENHIGYKWNTKDWLEISRLRPATLTHPLTDEKVWFNQVHLFDYNPRFIGWWRYMAMKLFYIRKHMRVDEIFFADDTRLSRKDIYHIHDVLDAHSIYYPWEKGDILALDNILSMHGRAPFQGKRRILAAMTNEPPYSRKRSS